MYKGPVFIKKAGSIRSKSGWGCHAGVEHALSLREAWVPTQHQGTETNKTHHTATEPSRE